MNTRQRAVIVVSLLLAAAAGIYPPWRKPYGSTGFHLLSDQNGHGVVDVQTLGIECAVILLVGLAVMFLLGDRKRP